MDPSTATSTPGAGPSTVRDAGSLVGPPTISTQTSAAPPPALSSSSVPLSGRPTVSISAPAAAALAPRPPLSHAGSSGSGPALRVASGPSTNAKKNAPSTSALPPLPTHDLLKQGGPVDEVKLISEGVRLRVFLTLAQDQLATIKPDVSAFRDHEDVLKRLVPYHLWQVPEDDLHGPLGAPSRKGKGRARDWDEAEGEIEERRALTEAIGFAKRKRKLDERFVQLRQREGLHASPSGMVIALGRELVNDELPAISKTRSEAVQARHKQTILEAQIEQILHPAPPPAPPPPPPLVRLPAPISAPNGPKPGPALPSFRPQQGYPSTPIYRPAPGGGTFQPSRPLSVGTPASTPASAHAPPPTSNTGGRGRPPGYRPPPAPASSGVATPVSRPSTPPVRAPTGVRPPPVVVGRPAAPIRSPSMQAAQPPPIAGAATSAAPSAKPTININAPHSLSVPIAFLPDLQTAGILPNPTATPPQPGLATDVHIDRDNVRFTVILATLAGERIKTLSDVLSMAHGAEAKKRAAAAAAAGSTG